MSDEEIPAEVRSLLRDHVETYEPLEILLLLYEHPEVSWTSDRAADRSRLSSAASSEALAGLEAAGLVRRVAGRVKLQYRYAPATDRLAAAVDSLVAVMHDDAVVQEVLDLPFMRQVKHRTPA